VLVRLSVILAPFVPFLAEELFLKLTGGEMGESVHLLDWPKNGTINEAMLDTMDMIRKYIETGLRQRALQGVKVRQPLALATISVYTQEMLGDNLLEIIQEELNVKNVMQRQTATNGAKDLNAQITLDWEITPELKREGLMRELIRQVQSARKAAGLNVDDRIQLHIISDDAEVAQTLTEHGETIAAETLAKALNEGNKPEQYALDMKVEGYPVEIALAKA
jgi:isoleucyl-tRNA synthetase